MNITCPSLCLALVLAPIVASAALIQVDLSPAASAARDTANYANGDHSSGLSALNAVGQHHPFEIGEGGLAVGDGPGNLKRQLRLGLAWLLALLSSLPLRLG